MVFAPRGVVLHQNEWATKHGQVDLGLADLVPLAAFASKKTQLNENCHTNKKCISSC